MSQEMYIASKVLLYEADDEYMKKLKQMFEGEKKLIGLRTRSFENLKELLRVNTDLGGIFLGDEEFHNEEEMEKIADEIGRLRPELPIFLRVAVQKTPRSIQSKLGKGVIYYERENLSQLREMINQYIFNNHYPNLFVRGIQEISTEVLQSIFPKWKVINYPPNLVKKHSLNGNIFSLIPMVSSWCNGYMVLEAKGWDVTEDKEFERIRIILGELTNRIWGKIKGRFIPKKKEALPYQIQVPILISPEKKHLSFGGDDSQLCFHYSLYDLPDILPVGEIFQKFVFHLNWTPEAFDEENMMIKSMVEVGKIELL